MQEKTPKQKQMTASSVSSQAVITRSNMWGTNEQSVFGTRSRTIDRIPFAALHVLIAVMNHIYFGVAKGNYHGSVKWPLPLSCLFIFLIESLSNQTHVRQTLRPCAVVRLVSFLTQVSMRVCDVMMLVNELQQVVSDGQWLSSGMHRGPDGGAPYVQLSKL